MSTMKRLFVAVDIPLEIKKEIETIVAPLARLTENVTWVEPKNYHFTLKFIGAVEEHMIPAIADRLRSVAAGTDPFELYLGAFDILPEEGAARIIYLQVGGGEEEMNDTEYEVEEALVDIGVNKKDKQFLAHMTIGRIRKDIGLEEIKDMIKKLRGISREFEVREFVLFESELTHAGPTYREIERFSFKA